MARLLVFLALAAVFALTSSRSAPGFSVSPCTDDPRGTAYRGDLAETLTGRTCQPWNSQSPHRHDWTPANYPNAGLDENYCRNPNNAFTAWCYTTDDQMKWEYCSVGYFNRRCRNPNCYEVPNGSDFRGFDSTTISGLTCQAWTSQEPHRHSRTPENYPNAGLGDHNLCRNPDGAEFAWCYTVDSNVRWEFCNIGVRKESC